MSKVKRNKHSILYKKICSRCKKSMPRESFYKNKSKKDGLESYCRLCAKKRNQLKRNINKKSIVSDSFVVLFTGTPEAKAFVLKLSPIIEDIHSGR